MDLSLITLTYSQTYVFSKKHNFFVLLDGKVSLYPNYNMNIDYPKEGLYYIENIDNIDNIENIDNIDNIDNIENTHKRIVSRDYSVILNLSLSPNVKI